MKKSNLTVGILAALLVGSPIVGAESLYPAADFQQEVVFQDAELIAKLSQPKASAVVVQQINTNEVSQQSSAVTAVGGSEAKSVTPAKGGDDVLAGNIPIILIAVALLGFVIWSNRCPAAGKKSSARGFGLPGETGVTRYLNKWAVTGGLPTATRVAGHVAKLSANSKTNKPETGVTRYLTTRDIAARLNAKSTGVTRYLQK